jgi:hypothetical protein
VTQKGHSHSQAVSEAQFGLFKLIGVLRPILFGQA